MRHGKLSGPARTFVLCVIGVAFSAGYSAAATLTGMSVSTEGEVTRVHVMLDEPVEFSHFTLTDPARLFLDCRGVDTVLPKSLPAGMGRIGDIEASVWAGDGHHAMARITMDLSGPSETSVEQVEDGLLVTITSAPGEWMTKTPQAIDGTSGSQPVQEVERIERTDDVFEGFDSIDDTGEDSGEADIESDSVDPDVLNLEEAPEEPTLDRTPAEAMALTTGTLAEDRTPAVSETESAPELTSVEEAPAQENPAEENMAEENMAVEQTAEPLSSDMDLVDELEFLEDADKDTQARELSPAEEIFDYELPEQQYAKTFERTEPTTVTSFLTTDDKGLSARGGARVSLDIQGADIYTVLRSISEYSGVNIVMGYDVPQEVTTPVSFHLMNVPWGEALEMVLRSAHLWYRDEGTVIRVDTEENLRNEELARSNAARQLEEVMPLTTRIVEIVYANGAEMKPTIERTLTRRGVIEVDFRTNSLVVTDIRPRVEAAVEMIQHLDSQTPQIEIVAKLVDVDARFQRDLGVIWGVGGIHSDEGVSLEALAGANNVVDPTAVIRFGVVRSWGTVSAVLSAMERDNKANIISNPRITTVNNRMARILVGKKIPLIVLDEAGNAVTELVTIGISLRVTPHINDNNRITLDLHPEVSDLSSQATVQGGVIINTSEADTRVMVKNGETAVIGGLIRANDVTFETGVPILKDIPLLGSFFKNTTTVKEKRELLIFVTPRIISSFSAENDR